MSLFEAMRLHKAFVDAAANPYAINLGALMGAFGRGMPMKRNRILSGFVVLSVHDRTERINDICLRGEDVWEPSIGKYRLAPD